MRRLSRSKFSPAAPPRSGRLLVSLVEEPLKSRERTSDLFRPSEVIRKVATTASCPLVQSYNLSFFLGVIP